LKHMLNLVVAPVFFSFLDAADERLPNATAVDEQQQSAEALDEAECGLCSRIGRSRCFQDCTGEWFGSAIADDCKVCSGGRSGHVFNSDRDCEGTCFGLFSQTNLKFSAKVLRYSTTGDVIGMDPHINNEGPTNAMKDNLYEGLVIRNCDLTVRPGAGDRMERRPSPTTSGASSCARA
ncbi:MAG: hypothetical protein V9G19_15605, partial [Tetrasphaera sp.]